MELQYYIGIGALVVIAAIYFIRIKTRTPKEIIPSPEVPPLTEEEIIKLIEMRKRGF